MKVAVQVKSSRTTINKLVDQKDVTIDSKACAGKDRVILEEEAIIKEVLTINRVNDLKETTIECVLGMIAMHGSPLL